MISVDQYSRWLRLIVTILKKRFNNLGADELVKLAVEILDEIIESEKKDSQ